MALPIQITVGGSGQYDPAVGAVAYVNPNLVGIQYYLERISGVSGASTPIYLIVGGTGDNDPVPGVRSFTHPSLVGKTSVILFRRSVELLQADEYSLVPETGTITLVNTADLFIDKERLTVLLQPDATNVTAGTVPTSQYTVDSENGGFAYPSGFLAGEVYFIHQVGILYAASQTGYTNGFNVVAVLAAMVGRRGWRQPTIAGLPTLDAENIACSSSRHFEDAHALVTVKNVYETQEDPGISEAAFNTFLLEKQKSVIMKSLNAVFNEPEKLQQVLMYDAEERNNEVLIDNAGMAKGFFFQIAKDFGISHQIVSASLYFNEDATFMLYLFREGKKTPIWSQPVSVEAFEKTVVDFTDLFLSYGSGISKSSKYYLCYFQDDLGTAKAIQEEACFHKKLCFEAAPFSAAKISGEVNFDRVNVSEGYDTAGLNLEVVSFRDHTQRIIRNANLFDEVIGLEMAVDVIEQINFSTRSNATERITGEKAQQLFSDVNQAFGSQELPFVPGLKARAQREYKRLKQTFFPKPKAQTVNLSCYAD